MVARYAGLSLSHGIQYRTVKTGTIENATLTLDLPLLVRSVSQVRAEGGSSRCAPSP